MGETFSSQAPVYLVAPTRYRLTMRTRKLNRRSGHVRVTQGGSSTAYPHPDYAKLTRRQNRYTGENLASDVKEED